MKDAFDIYATSKGLNPAKMWEDVQKAIAGIFQLKEHHVIDALKNYPSSDNFFELMRVDLVVDEDLKVYLLEANMSPNLSSAHYPPNQLLYEQVLYNLFGLTGVADHLKGYNSTNVKEQTAAKNMVTADKNLAVWGHECDTFCKGNCESSLLICKLCRPCIDPDLKSSLKRAHKEFLHRGDFRRLAPPPMLPGDQVDYKYLENLNEANKLQHLWYQGKCNIDSTWCT
ncbi:hypothetical protein MSG28_004540 [Choristoneura fumiferana]|uniref:Uncharacterized protein n=3 Tax=Choristoneura fumiferana TaxID=7141 RepID=A0ACC0K689_CHOFU|nr:hypothetical protein MSG28_004540 [Choristoneura fumiferana]